MTICYIWIENFRNFRNTGFNLSSKYKFEFDPERDRISKTNIPSLPDGFFGKRIDEVTAFIGKNGSGKSNAVELICKIIKNYKSLINSNYLIIYESFGALECRYNFNSKRDIPVANFDINIQEFDSPLNPLKVVFFSNVFDDRRVNFGKEITDVSLNNLYVRSNFFKPKGSTDFQKQIKLIRASVFKKLNIEHPDRVLITSKVFTQRFSLAGERSIFRKNGELITEFKSFYRKRLSDIKPENRFIHLIRLGYFLDYVSELYKAIERKRDYELINFFDKSLNDFLTQQLQNRTEEVSENILSYIKQLNNKYNNRHSTLFDSDETDIFFRQIDFLTELRYLLSEVPVEYSTEGHRSNSYDYFAFDYRSSVSINIINDFVELFDKKSFIDINWIGISSGHKAYLNLFATLYQELRYIKQQHLFLCIDEGDLYLHPMWQVEFFDKLIEVLPIIYPGQIQLLLTSHSPFLLSDLPNQNITILNKNETDGSINGVDLKIKTFGGNLYDLFSEPFFLRNKRTSDFAYKKIKDLILTIENQENRSEKNKTLKRLVNLIGDDVIRYRLLNILENND